MYFGRQCEEYCLLFRRDVFKAVCVWRRRRDPRTTYGARIPIWYMPSLTYQWGTAKCLPLSVTVIEKRKGGMVMEGSFTSARYRQPSSPTRTQASCGAAPSRDPRQATSFASSSNLQQSRIELRECSTPFYNHLTFAGKSDNPATSTPNNTHLLRSQHVE